MNILSDWKLTLIPATGPDVVILDFGWELFGEIEFSPNFGLDVTEIEEGDPRLRETKANVYQVRIPILRTSDSNANARRDMMNQYTDRYDGLGVITLRLDIRNLTDRYYQWGSAFFQSPRTRRLTSEEGPDGSWLLDLSFTGVAFTKHIL